MRHSFLPAKSCLQQHSTLTVLLMYCCVCSHMTCILLRTGMMLKLLLYVHRQMCLCREIKKKCRNATTQHPHPRYSALILNHKHIHSANPRAAWAKTVISLAPPHKQQAMFARLLRRRSIDRMQVRRITSSTQHILHCR